MGDVIARLSVVLGMETAAFEEGATIAEKRLNQTAKRIEKFGSKMTGLGQSLSIALTAPLAAIGVKAVQGFVDQERAVADVEAALRSMGGQSGKTAAELNKAADALEMRSLFDADVILKQVTANLLTFGNVAGKEFDRAQQAAVDMATRLGGEPQAAAIMLGKALNDPVKGIVALTRVGVQFTEGQKAQIKEMAKLGDVAGAQGVILAEVERQFAGAAQAAADATPWRKAQVAIGQAMDAIGAAILPLIGPITDAIVSVTQAFAGLPEPMQKVVVAAGILGAALGPVLIVFGSIVSATSPLIAGLKFVAAAAVSTGSVAGGLTVALTGLRAMVVSLVGSLGPFALAAAAVAGAIAYFVSEANKGSTASKFYADALDDAKKSTEAAATASQNLAFAHGAARDAALKAAKAERENIKQKIESARRSVILAKAELARARAFQTAQNTASIGGGVPGTATFIQGTGDRKVAKAEVNLRAAMQSFSEQTKALAEITKAINAPAPAVSTPTVDTSSTKGSGKGSGASGRTGPTREEIEARFADAQNQLEVEALQAKERLATNIEDRADIQYDLLDKERESRLTAIAADEDYTKEQKAALTQQVEALYGVAAKVDEQGNIIATANRGLIAQQIERDKLMELERDAMEAARDEFDIARDQLSASHDLADTQAERKRIALQILDLEQQYRRNQLEMVAASATATDAEKERARRLLASLDVQDALDREGVSRTNETDVERWIREADKNPAQFAEARSGIALDGIDGLIDGLSQIPGKVDSINDAFKAMRGVFQNVIQDMIAQLIRLQLQKAIAGLVGNIFGSIGGSVGGSASGIVGNGSNMTGAIRNLPGFATGTKFAPGGLALVGERGPELVNLPRGSQVTPNNELRRMGGDTYHIEVTVAGRMSERERRETGAQIASATQRRLSSTRKTGIA